MTNAIHRVVVIESDTAIQNVLGHLLEEQRFRVNCADNYARGELDARSWRPDVIITNAVLTEHGGVHFIRALRVWSAIPVMALSGPATEAQRLAAFDAGTDNYAELRFGLSADHRGDNFSNPALAAVSVTVLVPHH
jgi:two-component system KDP operon response regulator KdpE